VSMRSVNDKGSSGFGLRASDFVTDQVWGRPPVCRFTESLTPWPSGRRNTGPEARLTGRPEVCPTFGREQLPDFFRVSGFGFRIWQPEPTEAAEEPGT